MSREVLNDYECPKHGVYEAWGSVDRSGQCPRCGSESARLIGTKGVLLSMKGDDKGFPRASRMWADWHEKQARLPEPE